MVDAALFAIRELMAQHKECIFFGQDVGKRLGGVFREAATLGEQFGTHRVLIRPFRKRISLAPRLA
jgi:2-oxoisovalerate dehydrogenase E1 component